MTMHFKQEILGNFEENLQIFHVQKRNNLIFVSCKFCFSRSAGNTLSTKSTKRTIYTVTSAQPVTSIKQSPVLKGHIFLALS